MSPGPTQILIIALIVLLLFGAGRLSEIGKGLGEGIRNFKKGIEGDPEEKPRIAKTASESTKRPPTKKKKAPPPEEDPEDDEDADTRI